MVDGEPLLGALSAQVGAFGHWGRVGEQPVDLACDVALEAAHDLAAGLALGVVILGSSQRSRTMAMRHSALLASRLPLRLSRWRTIGPEDASMGLVPHSAAKDASLRIRSGLSPAATSSVEATSTPTPRAASSAGLVASHSASRSASSRAISAVSALWRRARQRRAVLADAVPVLFPAPHSNPDATRPFSYATLRGRLARWQHNIDPRDDAGQSVRVTAHQFRHTFGTRLINTGVPQHVIGRLLGHASPQMTARYAALHDTTVRAAFDDYCQQRVNLAGERIAYDPGALTAEAEWTKHNMTRVQASLPNGYCGRPPQQDCPHPNACLTCPDFQTTPAFLDIHRRQRDQTRLLIATAEADGRFRLADNHRLVHDNLDGLIAALEDIGDTTP